MRVVRHSPPSQAGSAWFGLYVIALTISWTTLFAYSVHAAMPTTPIRLPFEEQLQVSRWLPQGWRFYTRDPREPALHVYDLSAEGVNPVIWPNSHPGNYFGLKRTGRSQGIEAGLIQVQVPEDGWRECNTSPIDCLRSLQPTTRAINTSPNPSLCGDIGVALVPPVPWAWSHSRQTITMPSRVARVNVVCLSD